MWAPAAAPAPTRPTAAAAAVIARTSAPTGGLADGDRPALGQVGARGGIGPDHVPLVHRVVGLLLHLDVVAGGLHRGLSLGEHHPADIGDRSLLDRIGLFDLRAVRFGGEGLAGQVLVGAGHEVLPGGQGDRVAPHAAAAQVGVADLEVARADVALRVADRKSTRLNSSHVAISYDVF